LHPVLASAQQKVISIYISVSIAIDSPVSVTGNENAIASAYSTTPEEIIVIPNPPSNSRASRPATVPATIARIVTINKLAEFLILTAAAPTTLGGRYRRQGRQQKQTHQHQDYLAIAFHQTHKTSINPNCNTVRRE